MDDLYKEELMEIYKHPSHKGDISNATVSVSKDNSVCGDHLTLDLSVENGIIKDAKFNGSACAVSIISADKLLEDIINKSMVEIKTIDKEYLLNLIGMNLTTSRVKCATLILNALVDAIRYYEESNNTTGYPIKVTKDDNLATVIQQYPGTEEILTDYGLHCVGCSLNAFDSVEAGAKIHGMDDEEISEMVERLNEFIETGE